MRTRALPVTLAVFGACGCASLPDCVIPLSAAAPEPSHVSVAIDCAVVAQRTDDLDGSWEYDQAGPQITLAGPVCDRARASAQARVDVLYGGSLCGPGN